MHPAEADIKAEWGNASYALRMQECSNSAQAAAAARGVTTRKEKEGAEKCASAARVYL